MKKRFESVPIKSYEITSYSQYLSRREFMKAAGIFTSSALLAACTPRSNGNSAAQGYSQKTDEFGDSLTPLDDITHYNNYFEFSERKTSVAVLAENFKPKPWTVQVYGLVNNPRTYSIEDLLAKFTQEERIYRLRCVEAWSMVIPWTGFTLASLLKEVEPTSDAKFVRFETIMRHSEMKGQGNEFYPWPYEEGLRLDEAMHDLTILATGLYGMALPNQDGAPIRLVVPWKFGFKSIKAIIKIELTSTQPNTFWKTVSPKIYGFYSNVNPNVNHTPWEQASERRIGELNRRPTLMFNGYGDQVAHLYDGMNLDLSY
jgi:sulfoxide reductase catalytic subunit YedY